jgi:putative DNA methylase
VGKFYPDLFSTLLTPKSQELVATPYRFGGDRREAERFFEQGLWASFRQMRDVQHSDFPLTLFYAFKQVEAGGDGDVIASTGWDTMLTGLLGSGFSVTGTWPIRSERDRGLKSGTNVLASSILLVCRPRSVAAPVATRRELIGALRAELPDTLRNLQHGNIAPVDLAQAALGPGMAIFSRYAKVIEADGQPMTVRAALGLINQALDEILAQQEGDFDPDTRFAIAWFAEYGTGEGPFGVAETLSKAKNVGVNGLVEAGVLESRGGKVRLMPRSDFDAGWDPARDRRLTVWEVTQHLVKRLDEDGESAAAELLARVGGLGEIARELAYRLYSICERRGWAHEALGYNALVASWPEIVRLASQGTETAQATLEV